MINKLHWDDDGKWSAYYWPDNNSYRYCHHKSLDNTSVYFEVECPSEDLSEENIKALAYEYPTKNYVKKHKVTACHRCGNHNTESREEFFHHLICDRCYEVLKNLPEKNLNIMDWYEVDKDGFKTKIKE